MNLKKISYGPGTVFLVKSNNKDIGVGLIVRGKHNSVLVGYFFDQNDLTIEGDSCILYRNKAVLVDKFGDLELHRGNWPIIGSLINFQRVDWPVPLFLRRQPISNRIYLVRYDEDKPSLEIEARQVQDESVAVDQLNIAEDGMSGAGALVVRLKSALAARLR